MKELKIIGLDGIEIARFLINVKGDNLLFNFDTPLYCPIVAISLTEKEKKGKTFREKADDSLKG